MKRLTFLPITIMILLLLTGCAKEEPVASLKVGMMPAVDAAPFYYAASAGLFEKFDVEVELVLFTSGQTRQTALQTGQVDGSMTDLVALVTNSAWEIGLKGTLSTDGLFPLLAVSGYEDRESLRAGLMEISVTNYLLDAYLADDYDLEKVFINEIPTRLEALVAGNLDIGIFPEPFASIGARRGLEKVLFPGIPEESLNIIAFSDAALQEKKRAIQRFHRAYAEAVAEITEEPQRAVDALLESIPNLPPDIGGEIAMPSYQAPGLPDDGFIAEIIAWTGNLTGRQYDLDPDDIVDRSFTAEL